MEFIEDDTTQNIEVSNVADWMKFNTVVDVKTNDPFKIQEEELKKVRGLSPAFRRKMGRELSKSFTGQDETGTQQNLLAQAITGYAMFDLIEPPYNLEYLSQVYEVSTYNYSAINAKVSNIVGLGYDFVETKKTNDAFDAITDDKQLDRARRKLNKLRQDLQSWLDETNDEDTFTQTLIKAYTDLEATGNGYLEIGRTTSGNIGYIGHIPAKTMRVRRLRDGFIQLLYVKAVYFRNF
jgi:capsid portal protein